MASNKTSQLNFSIASLEHAPQIRDIVETAFRADDSRANWTADPEMNRRFTISLEEVTSKINMENAIYIVATPSEDQGLVIACIGIAVQKPKVGRLFHLAVDPSKHRLGLGKQVLRYAEEYCRSELGATKLSLDALSTRQELILWYQRNGFQKTGELVPFPVKEIDGLVLPEGLGFVQMEKDI
jgi:ribosomal protein S18 acetylase RimI-like enzyme